MSGLVKGVGKVFKKVGKVIKRRWKLIVIAIAVYFTAGIALSYFGSTAAFSTAMPGFGVGGIFSKAAVAIGFQGSAAVASGLSMTSGAFAAGTAAAGVLVPAGTLATEAAALLTPVAATNTAVAAGSTIAGTMAADAAAVGAGAAAGGAAAGGAAAGMSATDAVLKSLSAASKYQMISTLVGAVGGLFQEKPSETDRKGVEIRNAQAFGVGRDGSTEHGWASTGGSDAFNDMGKPQVGPQQIQGADKQSPYTMAMQSPTQAGAPFLPPPGGGQQSPQEGGQNDFIRKGYGQQGYMPYATAT
jgi:hypothetical protein